MRSWIDDLPERFRFEREALERIGFAADPFELERNRRLAMRGSLEVDGKPIALAIVFPDTFPFVRPEVFAPDLTLNRHQHPYQSNLCLLDRSTREWNPSDTGAWLVTERVPYLLQLISEGGDALRAAEAPQGEPASVYLRYEPGAAVFIPESAFEVDRNYSDGTMQLAFGANEPPGIRIRALLRRVSAMGKKRSRNIALADQPLLDRFGGTVLEGAWVRLDQAPLGPDPQDLLAEAAARSAHAVNPNWVRVAGGQISVLGIVFPEEVQQEVVEDAWVFIVRFRTTPRPGGQSQRQEGVYLARSQRLSRGELGARAPGMSPLHGRSAAIVGLGALGAPTALELARSGIGELRIIDGDYVELGTTVRWPLGLSATGHPKASVLANYIRADYPYTRVRELNWRIGSPASVAELGVPRSNSELDLLEGLLHGCDVVIDASAEVGLGQLLGDLTRGEIPLISAWATEGGAGGAIAEILPTGACWFCLQLHLNDRSVPVPPLDPSGTIQPRGCGSRTFTGSSFDIAAIANQTVRTAIRRLVDPGVAPAGIATCALRDDNLIPLIAPQWSAAPLEPHSRCPYCAAASESLAA